MKNKYVFILCPHYQGSTIILNLLNSSNKVSSFSHINKVGEGTTLFPRVGIHNFNIWENGYDPNYFLDLKKVKEAYDLEWDYNKPILVEKCPLLISRAQEIEAYFSKFGEVYFIISIRSPYSTDQYLNNTWVTTALAQKENIENLQNKIITTYEQICLYPELVIKKIQKKLPELDDLSLEIKKIELKYKNNKNNKNNEHNKNNENNKKKENNKNNENNEKKTKTGERQLKIHKDKVYRIKDKEIKNKFLINHKDILTYFSYKYIE